MIVADTSVWIDFFNGVASPRIDTLVFSWKAQQLVVTDVIIMEVLQGFRNDSDYAAAQKISKMDTICFIMIRILNPWKSFWVCRLWGRIVKNQNSLPHKERKRRQAPYDTGSAAISLRIISPMISVGL
jgi:predicted nucleic acid-binding protein